MVLIIIDFGRMIKRLVPLYLFLFALQLLFLRVERAHNIVTAVGLLCTLAVNLSMFWGDYLGKNAVMINMLPVGSCKKVFSKLLWGFMFSVLFLGISAFLTFSHGSLIIIPSNFVRILTVYLSCYTAMIISKPWGRWYYVFGLMVLLAVLTSLMGLPAYLSGDLAAAGVYAAISLVLFVFCAFNIGR